MLQTARNKMPAIDYVSIVTSLYQDRRAIIFGTGASAAAAFISAWAAQSWLLVAHGVLFIFIAAFRFREAVVFANLKIRQDDADVAEIWERRAFIGGGVAALNFGMWCFSSLVLVDSAFAELASVSVSVAALVGMVGRNFGIDRLIVVQSVLMGIPLCSALVMAGDIYHIFLASLFAPMIMSFRAVARDVRRVLLNAVHDRVEVTKVLNELDTTLDTIAHGVCMLDAELHVAVANAQFVDMVLDMHEDEVIGRSFPELVRAAEQNGILSRLNAEKLLTAIATGEQNKLVLQLAGKAQCEVSISHRNAEIALVIEDISERVESENRIQFMAKYDGLTGLPNRAYFTERVDFLLSTISEPAENDQAALFVVDIDDFKLFNDSLGHQVGDAILQQVSDRIRLHLDSRFLVGRFGGDEFTIFAERGCSQESAEEVAQRLIEIHSHPFQIGSEMLNVKCSIGYALGAQSNDDLKDMFRCADLALYEAKAMGKGNYCAFKEEMSLEYSRRENLKKALVEAIANDEISLVYQPIVDVARNRIVGCEALARWHHAEYGQIPPSTFIPIAEDIGAISQLSRIVLRRATEECMTWPNDIFVSVNISARDFKDGLVESMVDEALVFSSLPAHRLEVEVTETTLMEDRQSISQVLSALARRGVNIALDDFGTGYSSLSYIHDLPFGKIKIDRTFTADLGRDPKATKLMRSIVQMSKELDMLVTVEGVETHDQRDEIARMGGVDSMQGYLYGAPVPQSEIKTMVKAMRGEGAEAETPERVADASFASW